MQRRDFCQLLVSTSFLFVFTRLTGCKVATVGSNRLTDDTQTVMMNDIQLIAMYMDGTQGPVTGVLKVSQILENKPTTHKHFDSHGHTFTLTPEHYAKLKKGEQFKVETTEAESHTHLVLVSPKNKVPGSVAVAVPVNPTPGQTPTPTQTPDPAQKIVAALEEKDTPKLYAASTTELDESSVEFCVDTADRCRKDTTLWHPMHREALRPEKQIFVSNSSLTLDQTSKSYPLMIRGKSKLDAKVIERLLKLTNSKI